MVRGFEPTSGVQVQNFAKLSHTVTGIKRSLTPRQTKKAVMSEKQRLALAYSANVDTDPVCKVLMSAFDVINGDRKSKLPRAGRRKSLAHSEQVTCWKCENNGIPTSRFRQATVALRRRPDGKFYG